MQKIIVLLLLAIIITVNTVYCQSQGSDCGLTFNPTTDNDCTACDLTYSPANIPLTTLPNNTRICLLAGTYTSLISVGNGGTIRFCGNAILNAGIKNGNNGNSPRIIITANASVTFNGQFTFQKNDVQLINYGAVTFGSSITFTLNGNNDYFANIGSISGAQMTFLGNYPTYTNNSSYSSFIYNIGGDITFSQTLNLNSSSFKSGGICMEKNGSITANNGISTNASSNTPIKVPPNNFACLRLPAGSASTMTGGQVSTDPLSVCKGAGATAAPYPGSLWGSAVVQSNCSSRSFILPVSLLNFEVYTNAGTVLLNWKTATELETNKFEIERNNDGSHYITIGSIPAKGNSNEPVTYTFADTKPFVGNNYYRLKIIDNDGGFKYSSAKVINIGSVNKLRVIADGYTNTLRVFLPEAQKKGMVKLLDAQGRIINQQSTAASQTQINVSLNNISPGSYFVVYATEDKKQTEHVVVLSSRK